MFGPKKLAADRVQFAGQSAIAHANDQQWLVNQLKLPYDVKLMMRQKDPDTGKMMHLVPQVLNPQFLPARLMYAPLIALGDLHGSYQKLVETLIFTGLATMPPQPAARFQTLSEAFKREIVSEKKYPSGRNAYECYAISQLNGKTHAESLERLRTSGFTPEEIDDLSHRRSVYKHYYRQLSLLIQELTWCGQPGQQLVLIGDVLSDRGPLDHLTLDIIQQLNPKNADHLVCLASNHDHAGLQTLINKRFSLNWETGGSLGRSILIADRDNYVQVRLIAAEDKVQVQLESPAKGESGQHFLKQFKRYLQNSKLIHYNPASKTLFTHAPVINQDLQSLQDILNQYYQDGCRAVQQQFEKKGTKEPGKPFGLSWANRFWKTYVQQVFQEKKLILPVENFLREKGNDGGFLWRRHDIHDPAVLPTAALDVETLVHGHDRQSVNSQFSVEQQIRDGNLTPDFTVINLDQRIRKSNSRSMWEGESRLYVEL
ncbi:hypothetical protein [Vampirovibrio sp.]|uniref:hypothetical protein n=1 Tax=Vampirovibrio sp. TaxID=2717857 RepID=UPI0035936327